MKGTPLEVIRLSEVDAKKAAFSGTLTSESAPETGCGQDQWRRATQHDRDGKGVHGGRKSNGCRKKLALDVWRREETVKIKNKKNVGKIKVMINL